MTKEQTTVIPEELYNLTQLAEVAAERLTATDKIEGNDIVGHSNIVEETIIMADSILNTNKNHNVVNENDKTDVLTKDMRSLEQRSQQQQLQYNHHNDQDEQQITDDTCKILTKLSCHGKSTKKTENRLHMPPAQSSFVDNYQQQRRYHHSPQHSHSYKDSDQQSHQQQHQYQHLHHHNDEHHFHQLPHHQQHSHYNTNIGGGTFYSSSDDDSNYYSHKVFDRKKLRRSTISDNSRYDEHSSCSSITGGRGSGAGSCSSRSSTGSTSGDEQHYSLAQHDLIEGSGNGDIGGLKQMHIDSSTGSSLNLLDDEHICPECGKKYSTSSNLARHRQTHRSV